ncbi:hypothetical protein [Legionella maioricensis]|uniref:Uncharacterized protein n=1 Tax=Legionella maioricensis TaxID=2896528 RepID=A0A9X2IDQ5_9GAMM|nr:hypothetical protein [Legionella maioricensis]MCL9685777.1 hypothetical protein [Legionella maioricensis]MCL9689183.1 hypothetical protein [Legionella maioricensis]
MPEFATLLQDAKNLYKKLARRFMSQQGCMSFFSALVPNNTALKDALTISMLAQSLEETDDKYLLSYIEKLSKSSVINHDEVEEFKTKVLVGIYLLKWSYYNSSVTSYLNKPLLELFQLTLEIQSPMEMDEWMVDESLQALGQYSSFVYENKHKQIYADLLVQLGAKIQVDIHTTRNLKFAEDSSWYDVYTGIMNTLGMNTVS